MSSCVPNDARPSRASSRLRLLIGIHAVSASLALVGIMPSTARAEGGSNYAQAQELFREGRMLVAAGRHPEACERFERSLRLEDGIGTKYNLADCWETLGKTASAHALFAEVADAAERRGEAARARVARERADALTAKLASLTISVEAAVPGLRIVKNGEAVERESWGSAMPADPGRYEIRASAPGKADWVAYAEVPPAGVQIVLSVPPLPSARERVGRGESCETMPGPRAKSDGQRKKQLATPARPVSAPARRSWGPVPIGLAAIGAGGLAAGTLFALKYRSNNSDAESICDDGPSCSAAEVERHRELTDDARAARTGAFVGFGVGAAALVGAAVTYLVMPASPTDRVGRLSAGPLYLPNGTYGLAAEGAF